MLIYRISEKNEMMGKHARVSGLIRIGYLCGITLYVVQYLYDIEANKFAMQIGILTRSEFIKIGAFYALERDFNSASGLSLNTVHGMRINCMLCVLSAIAQHPFTK